ncbi:MAG: hypothetical protein ABJC13_10255 [Acidobacteriota bacterium]
MISTVRSAAAVESYPHISGAFRRGPRAAAPPRHLALRVSFFVLSLFGASFASAQVNVTATAGTLAASYTTLKGAFDAINAGTHQATITIGISGNTTEAAPAVLNASGAGAAVYTTIAISPTGGAARTISGAIAAGSPLIDFNGADNVTIDGLKTGGNSLTIANTTASATSGTSTIRFIGGATNNSITNSILQGSSSASVATNGGTIFFSTDAVTANGNDNNTISNNDIAPAGANLPSKAILGNGSTTTMAIGNSGIIIINNNIFDYFGAAVTSAGIATNAGCNTWSITNNRFYQTGTRTWTTGALHNAINIQGTTATSGAQAFTITGNIVGFASNTQTGVYTLTGSTGRFIGILFNGIIAGTTTNVNNNTVAAVSMTGVTSSGTSTGSPFIGILFQEGNGITNGNTIGSQSVTGSLTLSTTTTTATDIYGIYNFSSNAWTSNSNNVGGISVTNLAASGTFVVFGMRANTASATTWSATSNNVGGTVANSIQLSATGTASQVEGMFTGIAPALFTSNTVRNLTTNIGTGTTTAASVIGIGIATATPTHTLSRNTIANLTNTNAAGASVVTGIQFTGATANLVERNLIYGLTVATNSTVAEVNGIRVAGGTTIYRNNMIAIGAGTANAIGAAATNAGTTGINGINEALGTNSFFHNSVYIGGSPSAGTGASYAFNGTQTINTRSFRDNIFWNARSNGGATGKNYAVKINGTAPNPAGLTINNNVYFANGTGANFGFFNSLDVPNLAAWKTAVGQDAASFESNPQYNDPTNATPDLHIHPTNVTVIEANGTDVGVTDDFDGQTRASFTPTDIGADAGNFNGIDFAPPIISYTPLGNTTSTSNRTLPATITDVGSGVPTTGVGLPVIYFRKGIAGALASTQATSGGGGSYTFTINYALVAGGSVTTGDTIQYYVAAQDGAATPNVTTNPVAGAGGFTANPPAAATPPTTPNSYLISAPISGIKTVCASGCDFPTLTGATGIFGAINIGVATGNVEIQIAGDLVVGEDGTNGLNALSEQPAGSNFTVKIYPTGVARAITGAFAGALIRMNGSSRVTIDGSIGGTGTDRSLTITNTSVTSPSVVLFGSVGATPITNDTLKNCVVINGANTSSAVVISDATVAGNAGLFSNITIQNNDVQKAFVGVFATGGTTPQGGSNLVYTQNKVNTSGANAIRDVALYMQGVNGATVSNNTVGNIDKANDESDVGIWLATGTINATVSGNTVSGIGYTGTSTFTPIGINVTSSVASTNNVITGNNVSDISSNGTPTTSAVRGIAVSGATSDLTIEKNNVQGIINTSTGTFGAYGIDLSGGNNITVKNNFVSNVSFNMTGGGAFSTTFGVFGIRVGAGTGHKIYFNSVNLYGALPGTAATSLLTAAFGLVATTSTGCDVRDNIFANNITGGTTSIAHVSAFLPSGGTSAMNLTWNNNAYFFGTDAARQGVGQAGTTAGTNFFTTLAALAAYSSTLSPAGTNDNASQASTAAVPYLTNNDLHLQPTSTLASAGVPIAGVTVDIDNDTRSLTAPSIGADEVVADLSVTKTDGVTTATPGGSTTYTITASNAGPGGTTGTVADTFPAILTCTWTCVGAGGGTCTAAGSGNISDAVTLPAGGSVTYTASCAISVLATGTLSNTATVNGVAGDPTPANNSATDTDTLTAMADLVISKTDGVTTATPGGSTTYTITASNAGPSNTTATVADTFPATLTGIWTCVGAGGGTCTAAGAGNISDSVTLPVGGSVTYTTSCNISAGATGSLSNTATVTGAATDPTPGNNSATDTDTLAASANLGITKTDGITAVTPGGGTTYTITADNAGPSNTSGTVADTFPATLTCTWTCVGAGGGACTAAGSGNINDAATLPAGGSVVYTASCSISAAATGSLSNTATVTGAASDPTPGNNSATDIDTLTPSADLSVTKTDGVANATPGGSTTYTMTASNAGPSNTTATVADTFPASLTCTWTCVGAGGGACTASGSGNINDAATLAAGGSVVYTASCSISAAATGSLSNTATVGGAATDPTPGNNSATDVDTLTASADASITKTDGVATYTPGGSTTYTITASNAGPSNTSATVADTFDASLTCTWTCVGAGGGTCTASGSGNINQSVTLLSGGSVTYTASCSISPSATGSLINTATVTGVATDPTPGNNSATDTDTLTPLADLAIAKTDGVATATPGGSTTYTITASNAGPSNTTGTVADTFPATLTCTWTCVGAGGGTCTASGSGNINDSVTLPSSGSVVYTASCSISAAATGSLSNTATVGGAATDPTPGNNSATDVDTLTASADASITKTDGVATYTPGGSTTYTITASNAGPSNTSATVADTFDASLTCTWTCVGAGGGTCTASGSGNINQSVTLPAGGSVTYTASCSISPSATGSLINTATVTGVSTDPTPDNNSATDTDTLAASSDLSIGKSDGTLTATPGGTTTYTILASNAGPSSSTATVADTFDASLTCNWTCVGAGGGVCTSVGSGNISDAATLPTGASVTYTAVCSITSSATGSLSNTATVTGPNSDPTPGNNTSTDTDTLVVRNDIAISKGVDNAAPPLATNIIFTITAANNGPSDATSVQVNDLLPVGLAFVSATPSTGSYVSGTGIWTIGSLANGATATLTLTATVNRVQSQVNQATSTGQSGGDTKGSNNTAAVNLNGMPLIDIQVSETVDNSTPAVSQNVVFTVTARNAGPSTATGVSLNSNLPAGLSFVSSGPSQGTYTPGTGTWSIGTLAAGASATLSLTMTNTVAATVIQTFTKTAATEQDLVTGNDAASVVLNPSAAFADMALTKITTQEPVAVGLNFHYVIVATNLSPASVINSANGVIITDTLPAGVTLVSAVPSSPGICSGTTTVTCSFGSIEGGSSITVDLTVTKTVGGSVANTAMVTANEFDPNMANNTNAVTTTPVSLMGFEIE